MFNIKYQIHNNYQVLYKDRPIGEIYREVDGFFVFEFSRPTSGYYSQEFFRFVQEELKKLNTPIEKICRTHHDAY